MSRREEFTIREEHLVLLHHAYVDWSDAEFGAPRINPKRPYGNSSVIQDMAEILGIRSSSPDEFVIPDAYTARLTKLHRELETALQICLTRQEFTTGTFYREGLDVYNDRAWKPATPKDTEVTE